MRRKLCEWLLGHSVFQDNTQLSRQVSELNHRIERLRKSNDGLAAQVSGLRHKLSKVQRRR